MIQNFHANIITNAYTNIVKKMSKEESLETS